jgi:alpha-1,6-mannosyltransferase
MVILDINTFYGPRAGGIRTYHRAKLNYFITHSEHRYHLVFPGKNRSTEHPAPNIYLEQVYGLPVTRDPYGYRLMVDYATVFFLIRKIKPDVVEAGDPWLTGLFCLFSPFPKGVIRSSFYHSDPVDTYFLPWAQSPGALRPVRKVLAKAGEKLFYALQRRYFTTLVASKIILAKLENRKVPNLSCLPFGINSVFMKKGEQKTGPVHEEGDEKIKLLYAGRLDPEKGIELLIQVLPIIFKELPISLTVVGRGRFSRYFRQLNNPAFSYPGFIDSPEDMAEVYSRHDVFLAPGPYETFGMGVLEALACGLVAVGPDSGGTGEILTHMRSDFIFKAGNADSFYEKIRQAVDCDFKNEILKSRNAARECGNWENAIERMVKYYESLLS